MREREAKEKLGEFGRWVQGRESDSESPFLLQNIE